MGMKWFFPGAPNNVGPRTTLMKDTPLVPVRAPPAADCERTGTEQSPFTIKETMQMRTSVPRWDESSSPNGSTFISSDFRFKFNFGSFKSLMCLVLFFLCLSDYLGFYCPIPTLCCSVVSSLEGCPARKDVCCEPSSIPARGPTCRCWADDHRIRDNSCHLGGNSSSCLGQRLAWSYN